MWPTSTFSCGKILFFIKKLIDYINFFILKRKKYNNKTMANEIREITAEEFDQLLEEQTPQYQKWTDLEIQKIYIVTDTNMVTTLVERKKSPVLPLFQLLFVLPTASLCSYSSLKNYFKQMLLKGKTTKKELWNQFQRHSHKWGYAPANL